jgi:hypothetical protein
MISLLSTDETTDYKIINGSVNKNGLIRFMFPLCTGIFIGTLVTMVHGPIWSTAVSMVLVVVVGLVVSS